MDAEVQSMVIFPCCLGCVVAQCHGGMFSSQRQGGKDGGKGWSQDARSMPSVTNLLHWIPSTKLSHMPMTQHSGLGDISKLEQDNSPSLAAFRSPGPNRRRFSQTYSPAWARSSHAGSRIPRNSCFPLCAGDT